MWSIGLFVATFYSLLGQDGEVFDFTGKELLTVAKSHIMPMIMAMALYLWDVLYGISLHKVNNDKAMFWTLLMIILFMVLFVFSMLANHNIAGWTLFLLSWLQLVLHM